MMGPQVYEKARADAPMHVQLWRSGALPPNGDSVRVTGLIVRIFRDRAHVLHWGQRVSFTIPVIDQGRLDAPMPGGTIYHDWERMGRARWLEAFLESSGGKIHLVQSQVAAIRGPTRRPVCGPDVKGFICEGNFRSTTR
jgi:hypothetical protein